MTKERKLAIQMWEQIVEALEQGKHDTKYANQLLKSLKKRSVKSTTSNGIMIVGSVSM